LLAAIDLSNMALVAWIVLSAAAFRTESRAAHYRDDFPERDDDRWQANVFVRRKPSGEPAVWRQDAA
jgi:succinate dehydrogenase/fumarate reductase flavoprotein subunit